MNKQIGKGFCQCGCGQKTTIAKYDNTRYGWIEGQPMRYIYGHYAWNHKGSDSLNWKGGKRISNGYVFILKPNHPRADSNGYVSEHILIAGEAFGKLLPERAVVHHINGDGSDNRKENLVICENQAYHLLLHQRIRALKACGHASWQKCPYCKTYDHPNLLTENNQGHFYHKKCKNQYRKQLRIRKKAERNIK